MASSAKTALTILSLKICEAQFGALICNKDFSIQGEDHRFILHIDHAADYIACVPGTTKEAAAHVQSVTLKMSHGFSFKIHIKNT